MLWRIIMRSLVVALAMGITFLALPTDRAKARGAGFGGGAGHFAHGFSFAHSRGRFGRARASYWWWSSRSPYWWWSYGWWPGYAGYVSLPPYAAADFGAYAPPAFVYVPPDVVLAPSCVRRQETVTVASEGGGTRQISVTRCR